MTAARPRSVAPKIGASAASTTGVLLDTGPLVALYARDDGSHAAVTQWMADFRGELHTVEPVVLIDLAVPGQFLERVGGRVWVRFDHGSLPVALQVYRRLYQLFLQHFNPMD